MEVQYDMKTVTNEQALNVLSILYYWMVEIKGEL